MPTYEYLCSGCGQRFERFQLMSAPPLPSCPDCGAPVERLIGTGAAFLIRSGGRDAFARSGRCDHSTPCCGREERCDEPPCGRR